MRAEIESLPAFDAHVADHRTLRGCALQSLDLRGRDDALAELDVRNALFLGCALGAGATDDLIRRGALVFPRLPHVPFDAYRARLYTAEELYSRLGAGYGATRDGRIYAWMQKPTSGNLDGALARSLHDHSITDALDEALPDRTQGLGIMGGHALARGDAGFREAAHLARELAASGRLVVTGGGPGVMEAANLGASFRGDATELDAALDRLAAVPSFRPSVEDWATVALEVRATHDCTRPTFGVPTWFYGHEPPNAFATGIAKYFDNAIREDVLLALCGAGIVFVQGAAGTVQEIFQSVTRNYYAAEESQVRPLVLVGRRYWTTQVPVWPLLTALAAGRLMEPHLHLVDSISEALGALGSARPPA